MREILERNKYKIEVREIEKDKLHFNVPTESGQSTYSISIDRVNDTFTLSKGDTEYETIPCPKYAIRPFVITLIYKCCMEIGYDVDYIFYYDMLGNEITQLPILPLEDTERENNLLDLWNEMLQNPEKDEAYFIKKAKHLDVVDGLFYLLNTAGA